ncbi:MAG: hypothetical protein LBV31_02860 [Prevotellaceae bacterium]|jgi:hypothetical protein|nr:hypothetical protein [Prevotellaceae bacterium]
MQRIFITIFTLFLSVCAFAQTADNEKVTLKNGTVYVGKITLRNESVLMLQTKDGLRYQFPIADVKSVETLEDETSSVSNTVAVAEALRSDFGIMLSASGNVFPKNAAFATSGSAAADIALGVKNINGNNLFLGLGAAYNNIFTQPENVYVLQFFGRLHKVFGTQRIAPFAAADLGYAYIANENWDNGMFIRAAGGISLQLSAEKRLFFGLNVSVQGCSTVLNESANAVVYSYYGNAFLPNIGLQVGVIL